MQHAYASLNKALEAIFNEISPTTPVIFDHPTGENGEPISLPHECFRIYWLTQGESVTPGEESATVQVDIFVGNHDRARAREWASAINDALHFRDGDGIGRLPRLDYDQDPPAVLSQMEIEPWEAGWVTLKDPRSGTVHLARTLLLSYRV